MGARLPQITPAEKADLAARYHFTRHELPEIPGYPFHYVRNVHPSLDGICAWISAVGASVAMNDFDGDGLPNDISYVDPRTDLVIVTCAPDTPQRYQPFTLDPAPLPYNAANTAPMGTVPCDFNEDGRTDILVYYWGRTPVLFLRNADNVAAAPAASGAVTAGLQADPIPAIAPLTRAAYTPCEVVQTGERWFTNCATVADLDGDGHLDLVIGNYFPDGAHVLEANGTGNESMQHSMSNACNGGRNRLLLWAGSTANAQQGGQPRVKFNDASNALEDRIALGWTLAVGAADLDNDLLPEIYFANDFGPDRLLHNNSTPGHLKFTLLEGERSLLTPKSKVLGHDSYKGMGVDFADLNGDGLLDIYVSNIAGEYSLEESHFVWVSTGEIGRMKDGVAPYVDKSEPLGLSRSSWGWESKLGDFDNDGIPEALQATGFLKGSHSRWPELHELATSNDEVLSNPKCWLNCKPGDDLSGSEHVRFFARSATMGRYFDVAQDVGVGHVNVSRGIATADVDGDGLLDFAVANQWDTSYFYHNRSVAAGSFCGLHLLLPVDPGAGTATRMHAGHPVAADNALRAIGAHIVLHMPDGTRMIAQVDGGNGHSGKRSADVQFGLGKAAPNTVLTADLIWRDRAGHTHNESIKVTAGWQTIVLGSSQSASRVQA